MKVWRFDHLVSVGPYQTTTLMGLAPARLFLSLSTLHRNRLRIRDVKTCVNACCTIKTMGLGRRIWGCFWIWITAMVQNLAASIRPRPCQRMAGGPVIVHSTRRKLV